MSDTAADNDVRDMLESVEKHASDTESETKSDDGGLVLGPALRVENSPVVADGSAKPDDATQAITLKLDKFASGKLPDQDTLRQMVREILREELAGELGQKIARDARNALRRELVAALEADKG